MGFMDIIPPWFTESAVIGAFVAGFTAIVTTTITSYTKIKESVMVKNQNSILEALDSLKENDIKMNERLDGISANLEIHSDANKHIIRYRLFHDMALDVKIGYTTLERKREIAKLFTSYKRIGGNGEIEMLYNEAFMHLPLEEKKYAKND
jgi:hypothetical protein